MAKSLKKNPPGFLEQSTDCFRRNSKNNTNIVCSLALSNTYVGSVLAKPIPSVVGTQANFSSVGRVSQKPVFSPPLRFTAVRYSPIFIEKCFWNQTFDKGRLKNFVLWFLKKYGENKTVQLVEELKNIGFQYATKAGISLGIEDLKIPKKKYSLMMEAELLSLSTIKQYKRGEITEVERYQRLIDTWHRTSERLKQEVIDNFEATDILNPVYMMAFSGARGNISQVRQLVGMRGLMSNPQGQIIDFPIRSNFREGLTLTEYIISSYGARKGIVDTALRTANAGYLTRRLVDVAQHVIISNFDCGTKRGIFLTDMKEGNKTIYSLQNRLVGRVLARDIYNKEKNPSKNPEGFLRKGSPLPSVVLHGISLTKNPPGFLAYPSEAEQATELKEEKIACYAKRNIEISVDLANTIALISKKVFVRSALTCQTKKLVCQLCYGWSLAQGNLVSIGEAVGVIAAQSIGEPGTQLTMRTFHTGGVFSGDVSDQIRAPFDGIVEYFNPIAGTLIRTPEGKIAFLTKNEGSFMVHNISCISSHSGSGEIFSSLRSNRTQPSGFFEEKQFGTKNPPGSSSFGEPGGFPTEGNKRAKAVGFASTVSEAKQPTKKFKVPFYTLLFFKNGMCCKEKEVIAQISSINRQKSATDQAELTIKSELSGQFYSKIIDLKENKVGPKNPPPPPPGFATQPKGSSTEGKGSTKETSTVLKNASNDFIHLLWNLSTVGILATQYEDNKTQEDNYKEQFNENAVDTFFEAWGWGYAWVLAGKVYQLTLPSSFFPCFGDYVNQKTFMNQIKWNMASSFAATLKLNIPKKQRSYFNKNEITYRKQLRTSLTSKSSGAVPSEPVNHKTDSVVFLQPSVFGTCKAKIRNTILSNGRRNPPGSTVLATPSLSFRNDTEGKRCETNAREEIKTSYNIVNLKKKGHIQVYKVSKLANAIKNGHPLLKNELITFQLSKIVYKKIGYFLKLTKPTSSLIFSSFEKPGGFASFEEPGGSPTTEGIGFRRKASTEINKPAIFSSNDKLFSYSSIFEKKTAPLMASTYKIKNKNAISLSSPSSETTGIRSNQSSEATANWRSSFDVFLNWFPNRFSTKNGGLIFLESVFFEQTSAAPQLSKSRKISNSKIDTSSCVSFASLPTVEEPGGLPTVVCSKEPGGSPTTEGIGFRRKASTEGIARSKRYAMNPEGFKASSKSIRKKGIKKYLKKKKTTLYKPTSSLCSPKLIFKTKLFPTFVKRDSLININLVRKYSLFMAPSFHNNSPGFNFFLKSGLSLHNKLTQSPLRNELPTVAQLPSKNPEGFGGQDGTGRDFVPRTSKNPEGLLSSYRIPMVERFQGREGKGSLFNLTSNLIFNQLQQKNFYDASPPVIYTEQLVNMINKGTRTKTKRLSFGLTWKNSFKLNSNSLAASLQELIIFANNKVKLSGLKMKSIFKIKTLYTKASLKKEELKATQAAIISSALHRDKVEKLFWISQKHSSANLNFKTSSFRDKNKKNLYQGQKQVSAIKEKLTPYLLFNRQGKAKNIGTDEGLIQTIFTSCNSLYNFFGTKPLAPSFRKNEALASSCVSFASLPTVVCSKEPGGSPTTEGKGIARSKKNRTENKVLGLAASTEGKPTGGFGCYALPLEVREKKNKGETKHYIKFKKPSGLAFLLPTVGKERDEEQLIQKILSMPTVGRKNISFITPGNYFSCGSSLFYNLIPSRPLLLRGVIKKDRTFYKRHIKKNMKTTQILAFQKKGFYFFKSFNKTILHKLIKRKKYLVSIPIAKLYRTGTLRTVTSGYNKPSGFSFALESLKQNARKEIRLLSLWESYRRKQVKKKHSGCSNQSFVEPGGFSYRKQSTTEGRDSKGRETQARKLKNGSLKTFAKLASLFNFFSAVDLKNSSLFNYYFYSLLNKKKFINTVSPQKNPPGSSNQYKYFKQFCSPYLKDQLNKKLNNFGPYRQKNNFISFYTAFPTTKKKKFYFKKGNLNSVVEFRKNLFENFFKDLFLSQMVLSLKSERMQKIHAFVSKKSNWRLRIVKLYKKLRNNNKASSDSEKSNVIKKKKTLRVFLRFVFGTKKQPNRRKIKGRTKITKRVYSEAIQKNPSKNPEGFRRKGFLNESVFFNMIMKPGWLYYTSSTEQPLPSVEEPGGFPKEGFPKDCVHNRTELKHFILHNKKLINPGKTIGNDLVFDHHSVYVEIISLDKKVLRYTKNFYNTLLEQKLLSYNKDKKNLPLRVLLRNRRVLRRTYALQSSARLSFYKTIKNPNCRFKPQELINLLNTTKILFGTKTNPLKNPEGFRRKGSTKSRTGQNYFILIRKANEYKLLKNIEQKKEILKIAIQNSSTKKPLPIFVSVMLLKSKGFRRSTELPSSVCFGTKPFEKPGGFGFFEARRETTYRSKGSLRSKENPEGRTRRVTYGRKPFEKPLPSVEEPGGGGFGFSYLKVETPSENPCESLASVLAKPTPLKNQEGSCYSVGSNRLLFVPNTVGRDPLAFPSDLGKLPKDTQENPEGLFLKWLLPSTYGIDQKTRNKIKAAGSIIQHAKLKVEYLINKSYATLNLFYKYKTGLLNKQKTTFQTISKYPSSDFQILSSHSNSFYSSLLQVKLSRTSDNFFYSLQNHLLVKPPKLILSSSPSVKRYVNPEGYNKDKSGAVHSNSNIDFKFKPGGLKLKGINPSKNPEGFRRKGSPSYRIPSVVRDQFAPHNSYIALHKLNISLKINKASSWGLPSLPLTSIKNINFLPLTISYKAPYALDFPYKIPMHLFSEQYPSILLSKAVFGSKNPEGSVATQRKPGGLSKTKSAASVAIKIKKILYFYLSITSCFLRFVPKQTQRKKNPEGGVATSPPSSFLTYGRKYRTDTVLPKGSSRYNPEGFASCFPTEAKRIPTVVGTQAEMKRIQTLRFGCVRNPSETLPTETLRVISACVPTTVGNPPGSSTEGKGITVKEIEASQIASSMSMLSSIFSCPIAEYSLGADLEKSILCTQNSLTEYNLAQTKKHLSSSKQTLALSVGPSKNPEGFATYRFTEGEENPPGSTNKEARASARAKQLVDKEAALYKTELVSYINSVAVNHSQHAFVKTYTYCSFEGELIYKNTLPLSAPTLKSGKVGMLQNKNLNPSKNPEGLWTVKKEHNTAAKVLKKLSMTNNLFVNDSLSGYNNGCMFLTKNDLISFYFGPKTLRVLRTNIVLGQNPSKNPEGFRRKGSSNKSQYKASYTALESLKKKNQYVINDIVINFSVPINLNPSKNPEGPGSPNNNPSKNPEGPGFRTEPNESANVKLNKLSAGMAQQKSKLLIGEFLVYGDQISPTVAIKKAGQIIHINNQKITIRQGQPIFVSPKAILHKNDGDFIQQDSSVITLSYQQLKTGDIIQGIPKVEQFFEARTTKRGRLFRDSLLNLLKGLFKRYRSKLPLDQAVRQSFYKIQQIIVDGVQRVYRSQGVTIADKHLEVIVKQMTSKVRIIEGGQTGFFPGEIVDLDFVEQVNNLLISGAIYEPLVLGITKASLEVDSFLSAASFQQTTRVLSKAAISRKKDFLKGLKENVILGNLIPAGTGYLVYLSE